MIKRKTIPFFMKELDKDARTVTGIFAVHGNVDDGYDMSVPGSFSTRLNDDGRKRVRFLWMHNGSNPPIASIKRVWEVGRDELPKSVLDWAPEATGGVAVTRKYYDGVPLSDWVFKAILEGDIEEMSYAYELHEYKIREREDGKRPVRVMEDVELYDISDVNWGMNPATAGVKGLPVSGMTFTQHSEMVATTLTEFVTRVDDRKGFRESDGRGLSEAVEASLAKMAAEIAALLTKEPEMVSDGVVRAELAKMMRVDARLQGVI